MFNLAMNLGIQISIDSADMRNLCFTITFGVRAIGIDVGRTQCPCHVYCHFYRSSILVVQSMLGASTHSAQMYSLLVNQST